MKLSIKTNTTYLSESGIILLQSDSFIGEQTDVVSKLNVFAESELSIQISCFLQLIETSSEKIIFKLEQTDNEIFWTLYAKYSVLKKLQAEIIKTDFDYLLWPEASLKSPKLMLFDMDSTFIQIEVIDELAKRHGVGEKVSLITESAMRGELDFAQSLVTRVSCLKGLKESSINEIANALPLSPGVIELVNAAKSNQCETAIVSGGFTPFVETLKTKFNLFKVKANHLEVKAGKLTGSLKGDIVDAKTKALFLRQLCNDLNILPSQVIAIGDGANDLLMMQAAGFNLAYYAKPKVQQQANGRMNHTKLNQLIGLFGW